MLKQRRAKINDFGITVIFQDKIGIPRPKSCGRSYLCISRFDKALSDDIERMTAGANYFFSVDMNVIPFFRFVAEEPYNRFIRLFARFFVIS